MGRRPQPEIRERLLDACTSYALDHGLPDRMAPLADAAGTSTRMLVYHFGTRDQLLRELLGRAREWQLDAFGQLLRLRPGEPYLDTLARVWGELTGPAGRPYLRMFDQQHIAQLRDRAGRPLWPGFRRAATTDWLGPLEHGLASIGRPELATVVLATLRGLLMDLDATGDSDRAARAWQDFLAAIGS
ncbi:TetR/AcrR family transcriptional regulator [Conexibacter sp. JD483]|uniref:TetR/AcrR family transcriptional regulator n=1 Tax=unclassified Conexibacter TaxID=2627773 RepID=UPI00271F5D03|nr:MULTISPECIES: TetR/AcrR family transcriptional regulator [unclassified Conexibacter]MDO8189410.1 TetR/AcrR family transcriptional regulator [Conexibacter sp. CPCC 205706]MDO8202019.1 TetR/AcrR family transcriptional regulator [Conexibacter sp. CPCC 205762]MDR9372482.1 TetR/AcrR family transcriptional regulator [Conexibacter sp. JD483]